MLVYNTDTERRVPRALNARAGVSRDRSRTSRNIVLIRTRDLRTSNRSPKPVTATIKQSKQLDTYSTKHVENHSISYAWNSGEV